MKADLKKSTKGLMSFLFFVIDESKLVKIKISVN